MPNPIRQIIASVGIFLILALALSWQIEKRARIKAGARIVELTAELKRISTAKNVQRDTTRRNIDQGKVIVRDAERVARRIEAAPVVECKTPSAVMEANI